MGSTKVTTPLLGLHVGAAITTAQAESLNLLLIGTAWSATLIPLLVILLSFSTTNFRRKPIFILNIIGIIVGIIEGIINYYIQVPLVKSPIAQVGGSAFVAFNCFYLYTPIFVESILLFRLLAVYPPRTTPRVIVMLVFVPLLLLKVARITNTSSFINALIRRIKLLGDPILAGQFLWSGTPWPKIGWFLQMCDNMYASSLFLWRIRQSHKVSQEGRKLTADMPKGTNTRVCYAAKLRTLFWIGVSNFIFPLMCSFAQVVFAFRDPDYIMGSYIALTNSYVEIIGVLLATVWAAGSQWSEDHRLPDDALLADSSHHRRSQTAGPADTGDSPLTVDSSV